MEQSLAHTKWECKYHVVFIPKYRRKALYKAIRRTLGPVFHEIAHAWDSVVVEGHIMPGHVHMLLSVPPKHPLCKVVGALKGKSAIHIARNFSGRKRNFTGEAFWARGYYVSTVGRDEATIRDYINRQGDDDMRGDIGGMLHGAGDWL